MKKIIASAVGLMMVGGVAATTASAFESQFGGYWRTRAYVMDEFTPDANTYQIDNRTRLYYTAKFNDDFKFVNKFEFNTTWGDSVGGDIGADGMGIWRIKNSYADFNLGTVNTKLGIQATVLARGFIFDDDFSGIVMTPKFGNVSMPFGYIAVQTEDGGKADFDEAVSFISAKIKATDTMSITPYFVYWGQAEGVADVVDPDTELVTGTVAVGDLQAFYLGADFDMKMDAASAWGSLIYNGGSAGDSDISAFLVAGGVDAGIAHGQAFYATGDDNATDATDADVDAFQSAPGASYYWSEIMGYGTFDFYAPAGVPTNKISNVAAFNAGVTIKPMDKMKISADVWYAFLAEEDAAGNDELGLEFDGKLTYALMDSLSADFVLAYLVAGDAVGDEDVFEGGVRLSLKF
ncbi:MAG: hypothetical protein GY702_00765 [Desulfobulbaceae bacterium]|nr:hypothetical protein [Desulfobulbaceae bacterium]